MIIIVLILSILAFAFTNVFAKKTWQTLLSIVFGAVFVVALIFMVANFTNHYGMEKVTTTKTTSIVSSTDAKGMNMLLYKPLGNGSEKVYLYKTKAEQKKPTATKTNKVTNKLIENSDKAEKITQTTYWVYKNKAYKFWFNIVDNDHEYLKQVNTFKTPKDWITLSTDQAKKLTKLEKENREKLASEAKNYIQSEMKKEMVKNPKMSPAQQQALSKKLMADYQQQSFAKLIEEVKR